MREQIIELINEDISILLDTISNVQRWKDTNFYKKEFIKQTQNDIDFMLKLKSKYENKTI